MSSDILLSDQVAYVNESSFFPSLVRKVISEIVFDSTSDKKTRQVSWNEKQYNHFIRRQKNKRCVGKERITP